MFLTLFFFDFLIALKALEGSLDIIELNVWFVLIWRDLIQSLDNFLLSLHNLLTKLGLGLVIDLATLRFFLIWANRGHLGGLGGGGVKK